MAMHPPCRITGAHDWAEGSLSMWCVKCWLVKPYRELRKQGTPNLYIAPMRVQKTQTAGKPGMPHARPWKDAEAQPECCYCGEGFTDANPPTFDHIVPVALGGTLADGYVLACSLCNNARGAAGYDDYLSASIEEAALALAEARQYRRPKWVQQANGTAFIRTG